LEGILLRHEGTDAMARVPRIAQAPGIRGKAQTLVGRFKGTSDPYRNVLFVLMVVTISRIHQHFGFLRPFRPGLVLVALAAIYAYLNPKYLAVGSIFKTTNARVMAGLGLMACLSVPLSISIGASALYIIEEYSKVLLFGFLVLLGIRHSRDLYKMVWSFVVASGFLAYLSLFVYRMRGTKGDAFVRIQSGYSYDSNDIGVVAIVGLAMALLTFQVAKSKGKLVSLIIMACLGMTIARTGSRGAFVALVAVGGAIVVLLRNVSLDKRLGFVVVTMFGLAIAAPPGYWDKMITVFEPTADYNWTSDTGRKEVFMRGMGYMVRNPLTGLGINNFGRAEGQLSSRAAERELDPSLAGVKWSAAHNSFLQAASEMGVPGLILFSMLVFGSIVQCMRIRRRMPVHWFKGDDEERFLYYTSVYLPVALIGFAVGGFFVSFAYLDLVYVLAAFVAGLQASVAVRMTGTGVARGSTAPVVPPQRYRQPKPLTGIAIPPPPSRL
jgi:O-antigen ligase